MKKILFAMAVMLMATLSSTANAELALVTTNGGSFNYDPSGATADSLNVGSSVSDNGLTDFALYLGYQNTDNTFEAPIELTNVLSSTPAAGVGSNRGSVQFAPVTFQNGVSVSALATFRLADTTAAIGDPSASLLYDLELTTSGTNGGALLSLAGFDFNNNNQSDRNQPTETISGFGQSQVAIGDVNTPIERVLAGEFTFDNNSFQDGGRTITEDNLRDDVFNGLIGNNLDSLTGFAPPTAVSSLGDLGIAAFANFGDETIDQTFVTAGAVGFRSTAASNAVIPEPSTLMMASIGLGMVAFRRRKRA